MISRSSAPALESQTSGGWLWTKTKTHKSSIFYNTKHKHENPKNRSEIVLPHVPSQGPQRIVSQNPDSARLGANHRALQIGDRDRASHLFTADNRKGVLLKVTVIHLRITDTILQKNAGLHKIQPISIKRKTQTFIHIFPQKTPEINQIWVKTQTFIHTHTWFHKIY